MHEDIKRYITKTSFPDNGIQQTNAMAKYFFETGDQRIKKKIFELNARLVFKIARQYPVILNEEDTPSVLYIAIDDALDHYNPEKSERFATILYWYVKKHVFRNAKYTLNRVNTSVDIRTEFVDTQKQLYTEIDKDDEEYTNRLNAFNELVEVLGKDEKVNPHALQLLVALRTKNMSDIVNDHRNNPNGLSVATLRNRVLKLRMYIKHQYGIDASVSKMEVIQESLLQMSNT
jgi:DNA-directed RNA polymerase specialized sigma subunit